MTTDNATFSNPYSCEDLVPISHENPTLTLLLRKVQGTQKENIYFISNFIADLSVLDSGFVIVK